MASQEHKKICPGIFKPDRPESLPASGPHGSLKENAPPETKEKIYGILKEQLLERVPRDTLFEIDKVLVIPAPEEEEEANYSDVAVEHDRTDLSRDSLLGVRTSLDIMISESPRGEKTAMNQDITPKNLTPEIIHIENIQEATKTTKATTISSSGSAKSSDYLQTCLNSPQPVILPYASVRALINDLASRALAKGYRQPVNFLYKSPETDPWNRLFQTLRYYHNDGAVTIVDYNDPVQVLTGNQGMVRYEMWHRVWVQMRDGYVIDSLLPDIRAVLFHNEMTEKIIPIIGCELEMLKKERCRHEIYTEQQRLKIGRGIKERMVWLKDMKACIGHLKIFQKLLDELPDDTMMWRKWFDKEFEKGYPDIDYGLDAE